MDNLSKLPLSRHQSSNYRFNKVNDNLREQIQLIYNYWFNQFEFPDKNGKPYATAGGKLVWNDKLNKNIPENWEVESIFSNRFSTPIKIGVDYFDGNKQYYATGDVKGTIIDNGVSITHQDTGGSANMQPTINSIWFSRLKNSTKHLFLNKEMEHFIFNSILSRNFYGLQCSEEGFEYIASYISNPYFETRKSVLAHGACQEIIYDGDLDNIPILIPSHNVLKAYSDIVKPIYAQISKNIYENQELVKLRDWLLPMLMIGQLRIDN